MRRTVTGRQPDEATARRGDPFGGHRTVSAGMNVSPSHPAGADAASDENASSEAIDNNWHAQRTEPPESQPGFPR